MKSALALLALCATAATALPAAYIEVNEAALWAAFKEEHNRVYSPSEEPLRRATFKKNMLQAAELEAASKTGALFGANKFADLSEEEFKVYHSLRLPARVAAAGAGVPRMYSDADVRRAATKSKDWRDGNAVTQVKNQGQCGSCYSFSTTGAIEGQQAVALGRLVSLSEQQIVECSRETSGCGGGWQEKAMDFLVKQRNGRVVTEAAMPYTSGKGKVPRACGLTDDMEVGAVITGSQILPQDEDQIATFLMDNGPLAITVDATVWHTYTGGVMDVCGQREQDHAVTAVGVSPDFWIVKNSWGTSWGESGYIRLQRGTNQCLMKNHVVVPTF